MVVKVSGVRKLPWKVDIPASLAGRRKRKFFLTRHKAQEFASDFLDAVVKGGVSSASDGCNVRDAWERYVGSKFAAVSSGRHSETLKYHGTAICEKLGSVRLDSLTVRDIERFLDSSSWAPRTRWNFLGALRTFLRWCQRRDLVAKNPAERLAEEIRKPDAPREILSVREMGLLLGLTKRDPVLRAFVVLGGFAGIRSVEIMRMDWSDVSLADREIHVRPGVIKKTRGMRERYVSINASCARWLPSPVGGRIVPHTLRSFQRRTGKLIVRMQKTMRRLKVPGADRWHDWPQNCLRHSFASYLLASKQDAGFVAYQMGHTSPAMVHHAYARAVRASEAEKWWAL